ncbi:Increased DNA methylation 1 [Vitis vinifera]|uniref:Increased DNA methylation 1 n=1 Tax=Vitis vinifera TaxID=29760 RepID=A0A438ESQ8_VITVI|nr:Increased DNA methylation 1 [Vitis vinifera]
MADNSVKGKNKRRVFYSPPSSSSSSDSSDDRKVDSNNSDPRFGLGRPQRRKSRYEYDPSYPEPRPRRTLRPTFGNGINIREDGVPPTEVGCSAGTEVTTQREQRPRGRANVRRGGGRGPSGSLPERTRRRRQRTHYSTRSSSKNEAGEQILQGVLTGDGIWCSCCNTVITVSEFQLHAGDEPNRPYQRIFISETGLSLLTCQAEAWNQQGIPELQGYHLIEPREDVSDKYDDACVVCADGEILFAATNAHLHTTFLVYKWRMSPKVNGVVLPAPASSATPTPLISLYSHAVNVTKNVNHWECFRENEGMLIDLNMDGPSTSTPFCSSICSQIYEKLERLVGVRNELDEGLTWTLLRRMDPESGVYLEESYDRTLCNSKIAVAVAVMEECFEPVIDRHTQINVVRSVIYNCGANFPRISFEGFYTAILEKGDETISVASMRIHGNKLAEMPFIATRPSYRRLGMCHKLLVAIESVILMFVWFQTLCFLQVQYLVIPSIEQRVRRWEESYGFQAIENKVMGELIKVKSLMFHCAIRLQKPLLVHETAANEVGNGDAGNADKAHESGSDDGSTDMGSFDLNLSL